MDIVREFYSNNDRLKNVLFMRKGEYFMGVYDTVFGRVLCETPYLKSSQDRAFSFGTYLIYDGRNDIEIKNGSPKGFYVYDTKKHRDVTKTINYKIQNISDDELVPIYLISIDDKRFIYIPDGYVRIIDASFEVKTEVDKELADSVRPVFTTRRDDLLDRFIVPIDIDYLTRCVYNEGIAKEQFYLGLSCSSAKKLCDGYYECSIYGFDGCKKSWVVGPNGRKAYDNYSSLYEKTCPKSLNEERIKEIANITNGTFQIHNYRAFERGTGRGDYLSSDRYTDLEYYYSNNNFDSSFRVAKKVENDPCCSYGVDLIKLGDDKPRVVDHFDSCYLRNGKYYAASKNGKKLILSPNFEVISEDYTSVRESNNCLVVYSGSNVMSIFYFDSGNVEKAVITSSSVVSSPQSAFLGNDLSLQNGASRKFINTRKKVESGDKDE